MYKYQDYHDWGYAFQIQEVCRQIILQYHNVLVVYPSHETSKLYIDMYNFCFFLEGELDECVAEL